MSVPIRIEPKQLDLELPYAVGKPFIDPLTYQPVLTDTARWRLVAAEPINRLARRLIQRDVSSLNWKITPRDKQYQDAADYYTQIYKEADFRSLSSRTIKSVCELPQGGAWEINRIRPGWFGEGEFGSLAFVEFIDGGTLHPTLNTDFPIVQIDPYHQLRRQSFAADEVVRLLASPYDEFDRMWWQESATMASFLAIEALSRIYIYYLKQLHDTPVAGILDLMDFKQEDAKKWAVSFREMLEGIDPIKIPLLYQHDQPAHWLPMGRNPAELSIHDQFKLYAEVVLSNYGLSLSDLRLFDEGQSKAGASVNRKISIAGIAFYAELIKDAVQSTLPPFLTFEYEEIDLEDLRTRSQIRAADARTIQTLVDLPPEVKLKQAQKWGVIDVEFDEAAAANQAMAMKLLGAAPKGLPTPRPGQLQAGEGRTVDNLLIDAKQNAATGTKIFAKGGIIEKAVHAALSFFRPDGKGSNYGKKLQLAEADLTNLLQRQFASAGVDLTEEYVQRMVDAVYTQFPAIVEQLPTEPMQAKALIEKQGSEETGADQEAENELERINAMLEEVIGAADNPYLFSNQADFDQFIDDVFGLLKMAYEEGMLAASEMVQQSLFDRGITDSPYVLLDFVVVDPVVIQMLQNQAAEMVHNIDNGTMYYLRKMIVDGALRGDSAYQIMQDIQNNLFGIPPDEAGKLNQDRIRSIVNTELNAADSNGRLEEMRSIGLTLKRWVTRLVDVCKLCLRNEAHGSVPLDFEYEDVWGTTTHPPGHPTTCHCTLAADKAEMEKIGTTVDYWTGFARLNPELAGPNA